MVEERAHDKWHEEAIAVSFLLAIMGSYSTVCIAEQYRIAQRLKPKFVSPSMYLILMSLSLGGSAMWCMHFVGLAGHTLHDESDVEIHVKFDIIESLLSLLTAVVFVYLGLYISSRDKMFSRDKEEIFTLIIEESKKDSLQSIRNKNYLMKVALFRGLSPLVMGGVITGGGFCISHYVGMLAIHADVLVHWHVGAIVASVFIAVLAATLSFWILFRLLALYPARESLRILSTFICSIAMCGMHYVGMLAATYTVDRFPPDPVFGYTIDQHKADIIVTAVAVINTLIISMIVQADLRMWHLYLDGRLKSSRKILDQLSERYATDTMLQDWNGKNSKIVDYSEVQKDISVSYRLDSKVHIHEEADEEMGGQTFKEDSITLTKQVSDIVEEEPLQLEEN